MNDDNSYKKKHSAGIETDSKDPVYDVMSEQEIDEASERFASLLDDTDSSRQD